MQMTDTVINVYIESPEVPDLTLIDLPGINYSTNELSE